MEGLERSSNSGESWSTFERHYHPVLMNRYQLRSRSQISQILSNRDRNRKSIPVTSTQPRQYRSETHDVTILSWKKGWTFGKIVHGEGGEWWSIRFNAMFGQAWVEPFNPETSLPTGLAGENITWPRPKTRQFRGGGCARRSWTLICVRMDH